jgi:hypothetical protein
MTTDRTRPGFRIMLVSLAAAVAGTACTAILRPNDDVVRCATADDCPETGDPRSVAECRWDPENSDLDATRIDKICVAAYRTVGCDPMGYTGQGGELHPLQAAVEEFGTGARYATACDQTMPARRGCANVGGLGCEAGLVENYLGFCDVEEEPNMPAYTIDLSPEFEFMLGQDVVDSFCQSFFCDGSYVCNRDTQQCQECDPDLPVGNGGCGTVFLAGEPSCIYPGEALECGDGDTDLNNPRFGNCQ